MLPITVLIMMQNEEENIKYALDSIVGKCDQIIVTDSYSTDSSVDIVKKYNDVDLYFNSFVSWADQRNWMLDNCLIRNEIVFFLDADEYLEQDFFEELKLIIDSGSVFDSIYLNSRYIFLGEHLKYAYGHPKYKRIFKKNGLRFIPSGAREYANKEGLSITMNSPYIHYDRKKLSTWIDKHNKNATRESLHFVNSAQIDNSYIESLPFRLRVKNIIRYRVWDRLPLLVRPFLYFIIRYVFQRGLLDGKVGFIYCYLHAFWYQSLIDIKIIELKKENNEKKPN